MTLDIAHLSDLHFGRHIGAVVAALLGELQRDPPQAVIISGDLTQRARPAEFQLAQAFINALPAPTLVIPGNHDLPAFDLVSRFASPWRRWHGCLGRELEPTLTLEGMTATGLNSARRAGLTHDWSRGRINGAQLAAAGGQLADVPEADLRAVAVHHPFWLPAAVEQRGLIGNRDHAIDHLANDGVDLILSGHIHLPYTLALHGVVISHAGTATSDRLHEGVHNSYNRIRGDRRQLAIETREWRDNRFYGARESHFKRAPGGWREIATDEPKQTPGVG